MAGFKVAKIDDIEGGYGGAFKKVRATLGISAFGIQVIDMPPNADAYPEHDHASDGQEEVYTALRGSARDARRRAELHARCRSRDRRSARARPARSSPARTGVRLLIIGGVPGQAYEAPVITELEGAATCSRRSAEQVLGRRAQERGRARAVVGGDVALEAATTTAGSRESLSRTRSAAAAASSATAIQVACSSRPVGVGAPAPVVERRASRRADRDVALAVAPRAAEGVGDHDAGAAPAARAGARAARAPSASGSRGSSDDAVRRRPAFEASTPAFAQTKPWRVRQISTPRSARRIVARLVEHDLHVRAGPCRARRRRARARARPAHVGELDDARPRPSRRPCARRRATSPVAQRRRPRARRRSARRGRRRRGSRAAPASARASSARSSRVAAQARSMPARRWRRSAARVCAAPRGARRARSAARRGPRRVSTSSASEATSRDLGRRRRPPRASSRWRSQLPGPKLGSIASGGASSSPFVPVPWRSGDDHDAPGRRASSASSASSSAGSSAGSRRHEQQRAANARSSRAQRDAERARPPTGRLGRVVGITVAP